MQKIIRKIRYKKEANTSQRGRGEKNVETRHFTGEK